MGSAPPPTPPLPDDASPLGTGDQLAIVLSCIAAFLGILLVLFEKTHLLVVLYAALMFGLLVYPVLVICRRMPRWTKGAMFSAVALLVVSIAYLAWPKSEKKGIDERHKLLATEPETRKAILPVPQISDSPRPQHPTRKAPKALAALPSSQRPYIFEEAIRSVNEDNEFRVQFKNSSTFPATDVTTQLIGAAFQTEPDWSKVEPSFAPPTSNGDVGGGVTIESPVSSGKKEFPTLFDLAKNGTYKFVIFGQVSYRDLSGSRYQSRFCAMWNPQGNEFTTCPTNAFVSGQRP
jgi:hypothetical protein